YQGSARLSAISGGSSPCSCRQVRPASRAVRSIESGGSSANTPTRATNGGTPPPRHPAAPRSTPRRLPGSQVTPPRRRTRTPSPRTARPASPPRPSAQETPRGGARTPLAHQPLADQEGLVARRAQSIEIVPRLDAALADAPRGRREVRRQPERILDR